MPNMLSGAFDDDNDDDDSVVSPLRALRVNLPHHIGNEQESVRDNGWDFASLGGLMSESLGVLIIVPTDESDDAAAAGPDDRYPTPTDFSVPESIPSDLGSLHDLTGSMNAAAREDPAQERLFYRHQEGESRRNLCSKLITLLLFSMLVTSFLSSAFLFLERQSWHNTTLRLEEKIRQLEEQLEEQQAQQQAQQAKGQKEDPPPVFSWEKCGDAEDPEEPTLLVDNCWLHAKAKLELGKCANDAKKTAKKTLKEFGKANKRFWNKVDDVGKTWIEYMAGEEPDYESVPVESKDDMNSSGVAKITDARTKAIADTAKTIASGLAYASLFYVVVDESFAYFSGSAPARSGATSYF
jgi:hypothetical protein